MSSLFNTEQNQNRLSERRRIEARDIVVLIAAIALIVTIVLAGFVYIGGGDTNTNIDSRSAGYNDGWTLVLDGESSLVDLPVKAKSDGNGAILLKKGLPSELKSNSAIMLRTYHQNLEVRVNGKMRFRYPSERRNVNFNIITDDWVLVPLGPEDARQTLEVKYTHNRWSYFNGTISDIYIGEDESVLRYIRVVTGFDYALGLILITLGCVLMVMGWLYRSFSNYKARACIGMIFFSFGIWLTNRAKMPLIHLNADLKFLIAFIFITLVTPFIFLYCYFRFPNKWQIYSLLGFRLGLVAAGVMILLLVFAGTSVELAVRVVYIIAILAVVYLAVLLYQYAFGKDSRFISGPVKLINKIEFFAVLILPIAAVVGDFAYPDLLASDPSTMFRICANIVMIAYIVSMIIYSYNESLNREMVIKKLHDSQVELMMGQIQPHFIFNTLSSIRTLVKVEPDTAYDMIYDFSNYLRANVDNITNMDGIKFAAEVEHIKSYVNIEKVRFGDRVNVEYDIQSLNFYVPPLSIQPLVENAIKHGICKKPEGGTVWLKSWEDEDNYIVIVQDNGQGFSAERLEEIFSIDSDDENLGGMSQSVDSGDAIRELLEASTLRDVTGKVVELAAKDRKDFSGNGAEHHESTGMRNISLRLREMAGARMEIDSQEGRGTLIKVYFPREMQNKK